MPLPLAGASCNTPHSHPVMLRHMLLCLLGQPGGNHTPHSLHTLL
jgi:hypothetical protein